MFSGRALESVQGWHSGEIQMNDGKGHVRSALADCYTNNHGGIKATDGKILNHRDE